MNPQYILTLAMLFATDSMAIPTDKDSAIQERDAPVCCQSGATGTWGEYCELKFKAPDEDSYEVIVSLPPLT
jgi:hypothetical protein